MPCVAQGDTVTAGDVIAAAPGSPTIIAYAATLRLPPEAAAQMIMRRDGVAYTAGDSLGEHRAGLRTRKISAPTSGIAHGLPRSGAIVIREENGNHERRARYGGTVDQISHRVIVVASHVARCRYAFASDFGNAAPLHIEPALLQTEVSDERIPPNAYATTIVVAHIRDIAHLKSILRSFHGTLLIGSVPESIALALLDRPQKPEAHGKAPGIIVLDGTGDEQDGMYAVAPFRRFHGAQVILDRFTQTVTLIPRGDELAETVSDPPVSDSEVAEQRDPAHYGTFCTVHGAAYIATIDDGERALCVEVGDNPQRTRPILAQNIQRRNQSEGSYVR